MIYYVKASKKPVSFKNKTKNLTLTMSRNQGVVNSVETDEEEDDGECEILLEKTDDDEIDRFAMQMKNKWGAESHLRVAIFASFMAQDTKEMLI